MTRLPTFGFFAAVLIAGSLASTAAAAPKPLASATLQSVDGAVRGNATLTLRKGKIELRVTATGLTEGPHGIHLHATGTCASPGFTSAGAHLNPHAKMHGTDNPQGSHLGDLPNLIVGADGKGSLIATLVGTQAELVGQLFDADGTAVVIHAGPDDYKTDPSGNSGTRITCGVLTRG